MKRGRLRAAPLVLALVLAAGCSGDDDKGVEQSALPKLVLQKADLPPVWVAFDVGRQVSSEAGDPERFGRRGGWKARYRRSGTRTTPGPLVVESRADLFESDDGAGRDLTSTGERLRELLPGATRLEPPSLGDDALAATYVERGADRSVRFYFVAWREANVTASLLVSGFEPRVTLAQTLELARKQERRIETLAD